MSRLPQLFRVVAVGVAAVAATLSMTQVASAEPAGPALPPESPIAVPAGNKVFLVGRATGVQIYECNGTAWAFVAPRADLVGDNGKLVTTHFAGPTWQAKDGSKVVGALVARVDVGPGAIPWLLLRAASTAAGPDGDRLAGTTFIQRVNTTGGLAPTSPCDSTNAGEVAEIPYTADYYFWKKTGRQ